MGTIPAFARHDLTDAQWTVLEPLLPTGKRPGRPPVHTKRRLIDGIRWRTRPGVPWRDVPPFYGPWQCVYWLYRRWQLDGVWPAILTAVQTRAAAGLITWDVSVDSTVTRATTGADVRGGLGLDQFLQHPLGEPAHQVPFSEERSASSRVIRADRSRATV